MKAVILVGGEATRLRPLTPDVPKALVPILNTPFLEYVFDYLLGHRVDEVVITQSRFAQPVNDYFGDGSHFGLKLHYAVEETQLGTAGALKNAAHFLDGTFLGINGDILTDLDLSAMMDFHQTHGARATIALTPVADPTQYGVVETGVTGQVKRFLEKPAPEAVTTNMINAGTYVLEPEVLDWVKPATRVSIEREIFPALLGAAVPVFAYATDAYWIDIGTPEKYLQINRDLLRGLATVPRRVARHDRRGLSGGGAGAQELVGPLETDAAPEFEYHGVTLRGQVVVGDGSRVAAGSTVEDSVIWHHVNIGPGAWVSQSIIADGCALGEGCHVSGAVLGKNVTVAAGVHITPGARVNAGEVVTA